MDNGGEFQLTELVDEWELEGIDLQPCVAYSHHQNGVAKRVFQDIVKHAISVMQEANLPLELWYEISRTIVRIKNVMRHSFLGCTPYEAMWNRLPDVSYLRVIGSEASVLVPKQLRAHKFEPRAVKCHLIGYEGSNQYVLWDPARNEIVWARDLTIDEYQTQYTNLIEKFANDQIGLLVSYDNRAFGNGAPSQGEIYEDLPPVDSDRPMEYDHISIDPNRDLEVSIQEPISTDTVDINQLVDQTTGGETDTPPPRTNDETFEPEDLSQIPVSRDPYPKRSWKPSWKARDNLLANSELPTLNALTTNTLENQPIDNRLSESQPIRKPEDPRSLLEAMKSPDWSKWVVAMEKECDALRANETWVVITPDDVPEGHDVITCKWVFHVKSDGTFKCRWVARGFEQVEGWDYQETYAAVARADSCSLMQLGHRKRRY